MTIAKTNYGKLFLLAILLLSSLPLLLFPVTATAAENVYEWHFGTENNLEGWTGQNVNAISVSTHCLNVALSSNSDPKIISPVISLDANKYNNVYFVLKNVTPGTTARLYWATTSRNNFNSDNWMDVTISAQNKISNTTASETPYKGYSFYVGRRPGWTGTITQLRLDIPNDVATVSGNVSVENVSVRYKNDWTFYIAGSFEGWVPYNTTNATVNSGCINYTLSTTDPHIVNEGVKFSALRYNTIKVTAKCSSGTTGRIYWKHAGEAYSANRYKSFNITADSTEHVYNVNLNSHSLWANNDANSGDSEIVGIRIDIPDTGTVGQTVSINEISLGYNYNYNYKNNYLTEGKPAVFMGLCNMDEDSVDDLIDGTANNGTTKWDYVKQNLSGFWLNFARSNIIKVRQVIRLANTKKAMTPFNISDHEYVLINNEKFAVPQLPPYDYNGDGTIETTAQILRGPIFGDAEKNINTVNTYLTNNSSPNLNIIGADVVNDYDDVDYLSTPDYVFANTVGRWMFGNTCYGSGKNDLSEATAYIQSINGLNAPNAYIFANGRNANYLPIPISSYWQTAVKNASTGEFYGSNFEVSPHDLLLSDEGHYRSWPNYIKYMRDNKKPTIWLCPNGPGLKAEKTLCLKEAYNWMKEENLLPDVIVLINYGPLDQLSDIVPATDEKTLTGSLYWLINKINTDF